MNDYNSDYTTVSTPHYQHNNSSNASMIVDTNTSDSFDTIHNNSDNSNNIIRKDIDNSGSSLPSQSSPSPMDLNEDIRYA